MPDREPLLISACLLGVRCRYDGGEQYLPAVAKLMERYALVAVCPEVLGDMPAPRTPAEIRGGRVVSIDGEDRTEKFRLGAERALAMARGVGAKKALLKSHSPSCGKSLVYDGTFSGKLVPGSGRAAALLEENGVKVFTEEEVSSLEQE